MRSLRICSPAAIRNFGGADVRTAELLRKRLELIFDWYRGMVNAKTGMLEYLYIPETNRFIRDARLRPSWRALIDRS